MPAPAITSSLKSVGADAHALLEVGDFRLRLRRSLRRVGEREDRPVTVA